MESNQLNESNPRGPGDGIRHGPGPPSQDSDRVLSVQSRDAEVQQLRGELQHCMGKIKGYETLGHLFQESKQECARYKQKNEELAKRLDSLTRRLSPSEETATCADAKSTNAWHFVDGREGFGGHGNVSDTGTGKSSHSDVTGGGRGGEVMHDAMVCSETVERNTDDSRHRPSNLSGTLRAETEMERGVNLREIGVKSPPRSREKSPESSSASSPSFVQINSSDAVSPSSLLSSNFGENSHKQQKPGMNYDADVARTTSVDLSSEIGQITEHLKTLGHSSGASMEDLAADLIKAGVSVIKLQKQTRVQQVMIAQLNSHVTELQSDNLSKQQTIQILQKDCDTLRTTLKRMEASRQQAMQDARTKFMETSQEPDEPAGGPSSVEWVEVESRQTARAPAGADGAAGSVESVVTATPMVEVELRRRIEKLNATISELVSVNRSWDEHCRQIESTHEQQMAALQLKLSDAQRRQEEYERADQQRQQEFDNILLGAKKQREAEELAKDEALNQLHIERQQRADIEQKCIEFSRKTAELEHRLMEQQNSRQAELARNFQTAQQYAQPLSAREQELMSHLAILQTQLTVFKEDFDQERRDRESTRTKMEALRKQYKEATEQLNVTHSQLTHTSAELNTVKSESQQWRQRFQKLSDDLQALQRQARPVEIRPSAAYVSGQSVRNVSQPMTTTRPVQLPSFGPYIARVPSSWTCMRCTFKNPDQRSTCEMCGSGKFFEPNYGGQVGGRSVAGLQLYQPTIPYASLTSRSLETDMPDKRQ